MEIKNFTSYVSVKTHTDIYKYKNTLYIHTLCIHPVCIYVYIYICMYPWKHTQIYTYIKTTCVYTSSVCVCVCVCVCVWFVCIQDVYTECCTSSSILIYIYIYRCSWMYSTTGVVRGLRGKPFKTRSMWFATSLSYPSRRRYCDAAVSVRVSCVRPL